MSGPSPTSPPVAGDIGATPLRALGLLTDKRIVAAELRISLRPSKDRRYRVTDPNLRFWLHLLGPSMEERRIWPRHGSGRAGPGGAAGRRSSRWSARRRRVYCPTISSPPAPAVGDYWTAPRMSRSKSSARTAHPLPRSCSSSAPSSGWSSRPSTGTTWRLSIDTGPPSPANRSSRGGLAQWGRRSVA